MKLDRESPVPAARQLFAMLREQIEGGELRPGDRLPTEMELCERLSVSRTPVRRALGRLAAEGLIVRSPGRGTFVSATAATVRQRAPAEIAITVPDERWCWPLQRAATLLNADHPEQPVRLRFEIVGLAHLRGKLALAVARGAVADVSLLDSAWVAEFADRGYVQSLEAIDQDLVAGIAADLIPPLRAENSHDGQLHALPAEADLALLWYRKDWFAADGLAPPTTWDEWLACCRHFQRAPVRDRRGLGAHPLAFAGGRAGGETTTYQLLPVLWAGGADVIADHEVVLNERAAHRAVSFVSDLVRSHRVAAPSVVDAPWNDPALAFAAGAVAMALGGSYEGALIRAAAGWDEPAFAERVGLVPIPAAPDGSPASLVGGMSYAIYRQSRHPLLALRLVARATSADVVGEFCARTGQNPPTMSATRHLAAEPGTFLNATAQLIDHARARWPLVEYARVSQQIGRMFESAILGELAPDEAVARAAAVISGITGFPERSPGRPAWSTTRRPLASGQ